MPKRICAGLLAVWISGIVFLLCCGAPRVSGIAAQVESCPLAKKGHCDKSESDQSPVDENALRFDSRRADGSAFNCCGFLPQVFDKARKIETVKQAATIPTARVESNPLTLLSAKVAPHGFYNYCPRPLNRSGTYLKNRVFRI